MGRLNGKVAIITGSGGGQGKEEALLFAKEGAKVVVTDIQEDKVKEVVSEFNENGETAIGFYVTSEELWEKVVKNSIDQFGKVDILVKNAGISDDAEPFHEISLEKWQRTQNINLTSTFLGMKHVIPNMLENDGESIVNISSIAGLTGGSGASSYTASKGGVRMLTKAVAIDYAKQNIRVNSVHPGYIETPMTTEMFQNKDYRNWFESQSPLPRLGKSLDIANAVLYFASDESSFATGVELPVDGGYYASSLQ